MIDRNTVQQILDSANIIDVVKEFVTLHKAGVNYKGLCPFHNEKTPSFVVSPAKQICKCYGCGKGGNVVHFLMEIEQLTYPEAIKWLGKKYGIDVKEKEATDEERAQQTLRESMFILNEWAGNFFVENLHNTPDGIAIALAYFRKRGLRDDIIKKFQLGYSPENRHALADAALNKGFQKDFLLQTGLCFETEQHQLLDRYHGRVIYPVHTVSGKIVAFGGRVLKQDKNVGKYVNSPESEIYNKSKELYGLWQAKRSIVQNNYCFLVEGYMDVISMHQSGIENVVASSGTSLTEGQIRLLHRFTENITVLFDGDAAGIHASLRSIDLLLEEGMNIKVVTLPNNEDPDSFTKHQTAQEVKNYFTQESQDFIAYKAQTLLKDAENDPVKKTEVIDSILQSISVIPSNLLRQTYAHQCSVLLGMQEELILSEIAKKRKSTTNKQHTTTTNKEVVRTPSESQTELKPRQSKVEQMENLIANEIVKYGHLIISEAESQSIKVIDYIHEELLNDEITLTTEPYRLIYEEAVHASTTPNWNALNYFLNHPNERISLYTAKVTTEKVDLCENNKQEYGDELSHIKKRIPHLINGYKLLIIESEIDKLQKELQIATSSQKMDECMEIMKEIQALNLIHKQIGEATDRIIAI